VTGVKFCGITNLDDAELCAGHGAWALGMIFWPQSPRACAPDVAQQIGARLRRRVELAGVFVNQSLDEIAALADRVAVMYRGKVVGVVASDTPRDELGLMMAGASRAEAHEAAIENPTTLGTI
jgi:phosphoribosylanthranilate isomerase